MITWYEEPYTHERIAALPLTGLDGVVERWVLLCLQCHEQFVIPATGISVDSTGAISTAKSINCNRCHNWRVRIILGIVTPPGPRYCFSCGLSAEGTFKWGWFQCRYCSAEGRVSELLDEPLKDDAA
jgi:hypothetical protein